MCRLCPDHPNELFLPDLDWAGMDPVQFVTQTCALIAEANDLLFDGGYIYLHGAGQLADALHSMRNMGVDDSWFASIQQRMVTTVLH